MVDLEQNGEPIARHGVGDRSQQNNLPQRQEKRRQHNTVEDPEGLSEPERKVLDKSRGVDPDGVVLFVNVEQHRVLEPRLDCQKGIEQGYEILLVDIVRVPGLSRLDTPNVRVVGSNVWVGVGDVGIRVVSENVLVGPVEERRSVEEVVGGTEDVPDEGRVGEGKVRRVVHGN